MPQRLATLSSQFLVHRHHLMAYIHATVRDGNVAEDIFQEVWLQLAAAVEKGTEIRHLEGWCRGVARHLILQHWKRTRTRPVVANSELLDLVEQAFSENDDASFEAYRQALRECLAMLPPRSKQLMELKYESGLTAQRVAERLHKTTAAIKMALVRVRRELEKCSTDKLRAQGVL